MNQACTNIFTTECLGKLRTEVPLYSTSCFIRTRSQLPEDNKHPLNSCFTSCQNILNSSPTCCRLRRQRQGARSSFSSACNNSRADGKQADAVCRRIQSGRAEPTYSRPVAYRRTRVRRRRTTARCTADVWFRSACTGRE